MEYNFKSPDRLKIFFDSFGVVATNAVITTAKSNGQYRKMLQESTEYTKKELAKDLNRAGYRKRF